MELNEIQELTKLSPRKLRYVLDHGVLPGTRVRTNVSRAGHPRYFTDFNGFGIALGAALLDAGLRRELVARFFDAATEIEWRRRKGDNRKVCLLEAAFAPPYRVERCVAEIADGRYLSVTIGPKNLSWVDLRSPRFNSVEYEPWVVVSVDLARLRDVICKRRVLSRPTPSAS